MKRIALLFALLFAPVFARAQNPGLSLVTGTINAQASTCQPTSGSAACVFLQTSPSVAQTSITVSGTFSATLQFEWSPDGGTTWVALSSTPNGGGAAVTSTTSTGVWVANTGGASFVRVRGSAYTSGVATVTLNPSQAAAASSSSSSGSGTVSANNGVTNVIATYPAAGGSTTVGPAANTACIPGATSGSACFTAPAVAGTTTNPVTASNNLALPGGGSCSSPGLAMSNSNSGLWETGSLLVACVGGSQISQSGAAGMNMVTGNLGFSGGKGQHFTTQAANNDHGGKCTASAATTCTVTFTTAYTSAPACIAVDETGTTTVSHVATTTTTLTITTAASSSDVIDYVCVGNPN